MSSFQNSINLKSDKSNNKIKKTKSSSFSLEKSIRENHSFLADNKRMNDTFYDNNNVRRKTFNEAFLDCITPQSKITSKKKHVMK
jgi:hypothetical protein